MRSAVKDRPATNADHSRVLRDAETHDWQRLLRDQVNKWWCDNTDDPWFLLTTDAIAYHLYDWGTNHGLITPLHPYPFHRVATAISDGFHAHREQFVAQANIFIRRKMDERRKQLADKKEDAE